MLRIGHLNDSGNNSYIRSNNTVYGMPAKILHMSINFFQIYMQTCDK